MNALVLSPFSRRVQKLRLWVSLLLFLAVVTGLKAADLPPHYVIDFPLETNRATPIWLGQPITPTTVFATLELPITPPDPNASLLVTLYFQEKAGGFLRVIWKGPQGAQVLSDNLYEGIGMSNQRSLLITAETLHGEGSLNFQVGDTSLGIQRIKLEWLENRNSLVSSQVKDLLVTSEKGTTQPAQNLNGQLKLPDQAAWRGQIVDVPITDQPQRIEQGVEFSVQVDSVPGSARIVMKEAGLPWGKHLVAWINQKRAGTISPSVPDLADEGFLPATSTLESYIGWRDASLYVPLKFLQVGANAIQFSEEDDAPSDTTATTDPNTAPAAPLALKNVVFQLSYPTPVSSTVSASTPSPVTTEQPTSETPTSTISTP